MVERQVNHMVRLVDDLLEVSRIMRGKIELRKEPVAVATVVRGAVEAAKPMIEAGRHHLTLSLPTESLMVEADPVRLVQVLTNLLNNAAKYTPEEGQIWLTVRRESSQVLIAVRDNGMGIPTEMLPKVFDLFTQIDRTLGRAQGGLGIGLTLVRVLVEAHGGRIEANSAGLDRGSEFVVRFPLLVGSSLPHRSQLPPRRRPRLWAVSWWWTTTATPPTAWARSCIFWGQRCASPTTVPALWMRCGLSSRPWCCSISACRE